MGTQLGIAVTMRAPSGAPAGTAWRLKISLHCSIVPGLEEKSPSVDVTPGWGTCHEPLQPVGLCGRGAKVTQEQQGRAGCAHPSSHRCACRYSTGSCYSWLFYLLCTAQGCAKQPTQSSEHILTLLFPSHPFPSPFCRAGALLPLLPREHCRTMQVVAAAWFLKPSLHPEFIFPPKQGYCC